MNRRTLLISAAAAAAHVPAGRAAAPAEGRYLYVAVPGVRNYLEYGGSGFLVFDVDRGHRWVKRIPGLPAAPGAAPENVKGICASARTRLLHITTPKRLACWNLLTEELLWQREYPGGCDRMALSPDGSNIYLPSFEGPHWHSVDAVTGEILARLEPNSGAHNTIYDLSGRRAYLAGLKSPYLYLADTREHELAGRVGPFAHSIRPFTVDGRGRRCYVNVNELLGFEIGDIATGKKLARIEVPGFKRGPVKRHGCPSHGIGMTPDETEIWVTDANNSRLHIFDLTRDTPRLIESVPVRDQPGWITFSKDGRYCYPSTGEVIDTKTKRTAATLRDELGREVQSEKMVEIEFRAGAPVSTSDQFGIGRRR